MTGFEEGWKLAGSQEKALDLAMLFGFGDHEGG